MMNRYFKSLQLFSILAVMALVVSCKGDPLAEMQKTELMSHGFPIAVFVPEGADIKKGDFGVMQDLTIKAGDDYYVQIFSSDAHTTDVKKVLNDKLSEAKSHPYFSKIIQEDEQGFIFEKDVDGKLNYDFRYVKLQGDKEYVFQTGLIGNYTEEQVRAMYQSVQ